MRLRVGIAEINDFQLLAGEGQQQVGGLQVPVDHPLRVKVGERVAQLIRQGAGFRRGQAGLVQRTAIDPFHFNRIPISGHIQIGVVLY